ncbi:hypothetical protein GCM10022234_05850 [Aeromicrobium panaciterrae]|uniref:hypothetical protein n=1 Tax=Aeromicrobium panaciterrae TaxID=363861 RepID=UPI0031D02751
MPPTDLIADLAKKSGLVWVTYARHTHAVWHEWVGDAVCVVAGGTEQPLPDIEKHQTVTLSLRSKATRALVAEAEARVEVVTPGSEHWDVVTETLKGGRLNITDGDHAIERWARESVVVRLVPTGTVTLAADVSSSLPRTSPHLSRS